MPEYLKAISEVTQVIAVMAGVVLSIRSFSAARIKDAAARQAEAEARTLELQKYRDQRRVESIRPFAELRQQLYLDAVRAASVLSNPYLHTSDELAAARKRFWELYWGELSLVENIPIEKAMERLGDIFDSQLQCTPAQLATYELAHLFRDSLERTWGITEPIEPKP